METADHLKAGVKSSGHKDPISLLSCSGHLVAFAELIVMAPHPIDDVFLNTQRAHGIIDDGTGTAILLELARFLKDQSVSNTRFTFGFFGAEEAGLVGSTFYYLNREVDKDKLHVISVDMIGEKPPLRLPLGIV